MERPPSSERRKRRRFNRESWLEAALEVLAREGNASLRVEPLSHELDVSKGSFYWHFESRDAFLHALFEHWAERYTRRVKAESESAGGDARHRLRTLVTLVLREDLSRYDSAFDSWASHEPSIAARVREVKRFRWRYIRSLLAELGFEGRELDLRTRALLSYVQFQPSGPAKNGRVSDEEIDELLEFFLRS